MSGNGARNRSILELGSDEARTFFLKQESYCSIDFPPYFKFNDLLSSVSKQLNDKELSDLKKARCFEGVNHAVLHNKDGRHAWRPLQLIHPALYVSLVDRLTEQDQWKLVCDRFEEFATNDEKIRCLSIPVESLTDEGDKAEQVSRWWHSVEQASIKLAPNGLGQATKAAQLATSGGGTTSGGGGSVVVLPINGFLVIPTSTSNGTTSTATFASGITDSAVSGQNKAFTYDGLSRLKTASGAWGAGTFTYDALDNIRKKQLGSRIVDIEYNSVNRLNRARDTGDGNAWKNYSYDTRGNVTNNGTFGFTYDFADQPIAVTGGSANGSFVYDGNRKRAKQVVGGKTIYSVYGASGALIHRDDVTANAKTDYIRAAGKTIARIKAGTVSYVHQDHLGSPVASTTEASAIAWREDFTPYGEKRLDPTTNKDDEGFTGHIDDSATGLTCMKARYYDPLIGRFLSNDPVGFKEGGIGYFNRYAYVGNDPANGIDPTGMAQCSGKLAGNATNCGIALANADLARNKLNAAAAALEKIASIPYSNLSDAQKLNFAAIKTYFGSDSKATIKNVASAIRNQAKTIGARGSDVKLRQTASRISSAGVGGGPINLGQDFFYKTNSKFERTRIMIHESGHSAGRRDLPVPVGDPRYAYITSRSSINGTVRFYGDDGAKALARHQPGKARRNNDNINCYVYFC